AVIVGGGIVGTSVAYHLAGLGWSEVVLLEQGRLSGGTTWHAAGLVGQLRSSSNLTQLIRYSADLYSRLETETGQATGWKRRGGAGVARPRRRMVQLGGTAAVGRSFGFEAEVISAKKAGEPSPLMRTDDLVGAVWIAGDGKANPADITQALARGARNGGGRIFEKTRGTAIDTRDGRGTRVATTQGASQAENLGNFRGAKGAPPPPPVRPPTP